MNPESKHASAPGTLMLMGEHGVLHGGRALVAAVDKRLSVTATPRADRQVTVASALGSVEIALDRVEPVAPFTFVLAAVKAYCPRLTQGLDLTIESEISSTQGLGSSAAVTVAVQAALAALTGRSLTEREAIEEGLSTIREVQGMGSGADVAACVLGGTVLYRAEPFETRKLAASPPLTTVYSGSKTPTPVVVAMVEEARQKEPERFQVLFDEMDKLVGLGAAALEKEDWDELGRLFTLNQGLMRQLGVSNEHLTELVGRLEGCPGIYGAKISGSGLGDCVIGLGRTDALLTGYEAVAVEISPKGVAVAEANE